MQEKYKQCINAIKSQNNATNQPCCILYSAILTICSSLFLDEKKNPFYFILQIISNYT